MPRVRIYQIVCIWITIMVSTALSFAQEPYIFKGSPFRIVNHDFVIIYVISSFCATFISEYLVIALFLRKEKRVWLGLFFWVLLINIITSPLSQAAMVFIDYGGLWEIAPVEMGKKLTYQNVFMWLIALITVIPKYNILKWVLGRMYRQGILDELMTHERILTIVIIAVFVGFLLGRISGDIVAMTICFPEPVGYYSLAQFTRR